MCEHMETLHGVTDDEAKKLEEHNFENLTDIEMEKVRIGMTDSTFFIYREVEVRIRSE